MAAMVAGMAAADPAVDIGLTEINGNAQVTWGVDLDTGKTGFKNDVGGNLKLNLVSGSKSTEADNEDIWAELAFKLDGNFLINDEHDANASKGADKGLAGNWVIDTAKFHFYNFYVGIQEGDTEVGQVQLHTAVRSNDEVTTLANVGETRKYGLVFGYGDNKNFGVALDFRSNAEGTDPENYYNNDYGMALEANLLAGNDFLEGLFATVGGSLKFNAENQFGLAASVGYKAKINDTFYFRPVVGWTETGDWNGPSKTGNKIAGALLLGWGDTADANAGVYYLNDDYAKDVTPGFSVAVYAPLVENPTIEITPSFFSGTIVPNLTAGIFSDIVIPTTDGAEVGFGIAGGVKYDLKATDSVTVTPQVGARFATKDLLGQGNDTSSHGNVFTHDGSTAVNTDNGGVADNNEATADGLLNVKVGVDVAGLLNNTTFGVWWQSRNLLNTADDAKKAGTLNVYAKIAF